MKILFGSDISFNYFKEFTSKEAAVETMAEAAELFAKADYSMVNLENIFGRAEDGERIIKSGPNLISDDRFIEYIHAIKPNIVGLANNHTMDFGENIMYHTMELLSESGYTCIGAGKNVEEAYAPAKIEKDGIRVAIIAVCENEFGPADEHAPGTAGYNLGKVTKAIFGAIQEGYKPIIYFHGGNERNPFPSPGKVELYRHFIDLGAEAVIAMHTHCPQGYEFYNGKPIVYSMGNFLFPTTRIQKKAWYYGYMSELNLTESGASLTIHPYKFDFEKHTLLQGKDKEEFLRYLSCISEPIQDTLKLRELFDNWCMVSNGYVNTLETYNRELISDGPPKRVRDLRNLFTCEAHNEVIKNTFLMIYDSRIESSKEGVAYISSLQEMEGFDC